MSEYIINNIPVSFPFEPYPVQKSYMEKVIECLQNVSLLVLLVTILYFVRSNNLIFIHFRVKMEF